MVRINARTEKDGERNVLLFAMFQCITQNELNYLKAKHLGVQSAMRGRLQVIKETVPVFLKMSWNKEYSKSTLKRAKELAKHEFLLWKQGMR